MIPSRGKYNSNNRSTNYDLTSSEDDDFLFDSNNTSLDDLLEQDSFYGHNDNGVKKVYVQRRRAHFETFFLLN